MEQPALDMPRQGGPGPRPASAIGSLLDRLMQRVQTRDLGDEEGSTSLDDWQPTQVVFTTVRPLETAQVPAAGAAPAKLAGGVTLQRHPALQAKARLTAVAAASRDLGNLALPRLLRDDPSVCQPFVVASDAQRLARPSVLELTDVTAPEAVTPQEPAAARGPGDAGRGRARPPGRLRRRVLPAAGPGRRRAADAGPRSSSTGCPAARGRDLPESAAQPAGSIKIFFQKVVCEVLGRSSNIPILAAADVDDRAATSGSSTRRTRQGQGAGSPRPNASCCWSTGSSATPWRCPAGQLGPSSAPTAGRSTRRTTWC